MNKKKELKFLKTQSKYVQDLEIEVGDQLENIENSIGKWIDKLSK